MRFGTAAKLSTSLLFSVLAFLSPWQVSLSFIPFIVVLEMSAAPFRPISAAAHKSFRRLIYYLTFLGFFIVCINGIFIKGHEELTQIWGLSFYREGIEFGLRVSARLILLATSILLFFVSTPIKAFVDILAQVGLPTSLVVIILLSIYYLEQLPGRIAQIFLAQEARGAPVRANLFLRTKSFLSILSPLALSSLVESVERGVALELRGFQEDKRISPPRNSADFRTAILILLATLILILGFVIWK